MPADPKYNHFRSPDAKPRNQFASQLFQGWARAMQDFDAGDDDAAKFLRAFVLGAGSGFAKQEKDAKEGGGDQPLIPLAGSSTNGRASGVPAPGAPGVNLMLDGEFVPGGIAESFREQIAFNPNTGKFNIAGRDVDASTVKVFDDLFDLSGKRAGDAARNDRDFQLRSDEFAFAQQRHEDDLSFRERAMRIDEARERRAARKDDFEMAESRRARQEARARQKAGTLVNVAEWDRFLQAREQQAQVRQALDEDPGDVGVDPGLDAAMRAYAEVATREEFVAAMDRLTSGDADAQQQALDQLTARTSAGAEARLTLRAKDARERVRQSRESLKALERARASAIENMDWDSDDKAEYREAVAALQRQIDLDSKAAMVYEGSIPFRRQPGDPQSLDRHFARLGPGALRQFQALLDQVFEIESERGLDFDTAMTQAIDSGDEAAVAALQAEYAEIARSFVTEELGWYWEPVNDPNAFAPEFP